MTRLFTLVGLATLVAGCAPMRAPVPFHFAESAHVLEPGAISLSGTLGTGKMNYGKASGAALRARLGLGARMEVGVGGLALAVEEEGTATVQQPWKGTSTMAAGKIDWKWGPMPWLAILAGAGGGHAETGNALGGDAGVLVSAPRALAGHWRPYLGVRYTLAYPSGDHHLEAGGPLQGTVLALGTGFDLGERHALFLEFGSLKSKSRGYMSTAADLNRTVQEPSRGGNYLALAYSYTIPK